MKKYKLEISRDDFTESPRNWDNIGTMLCTHRRYNLGDEERLSSSDILVRIADDVGIDTEPFRNGDMDEEDLYKQVMEHTENAVILPLSLHDHSGISMSVGVQRGWDSGQVGFIYATKEHLREELGHSENELFSSDKNREPVVGEHVKIAGNENFGKIVSMDGNSVVVDFDYRKSEAYKNPDNKVTIDKSLISEVMSEMAKAHLEGEVETYTNYLEGNVYEYTLQELDEDGDEIDMDSCGGFYGDNIKENGILENLPKEIRDQVEKYSLDADDYSGGVEFDVDDGVLEITPAIKAKMCEMLVEEDVTNISDAVNSGDTELLHSILSGETQIYKDMNIGELRGCYEQVFGEKVEESAWVKEFSGSVAEIAAGAGDADKDAVAANVRELSGDKSTNRDLV